MSWPPPFVCVASIIRLEGMYGTMVRFLTLNDLPKMYLDSRQCDGWVTHSNYTHVCKYLILLTLLTFLENRSMLDVCEATFQFNWFPSVHRASYT